MERGLAAAEPVMAGQASLPEFLHTRSWFAQQKKDLPGACAALAAAVDAQARMAEAEKDKRRQQQIQRRVDEWRLNLAALQIRNGDKDQARKTLETVIQVKGQHPPFLERARKMLEGL